jgi:hypothetical protein
MIKIIRLTFGQEADSDEDEEADSDEDEETDSDEEEETDSDEEEEADSDEEASGYSSLISSISYRPRRKTW